MIKTIIESQRSELERRLREPYVRREIEIRGLKTDLINVIIGPRRAGKSFFCMHSLGEGTQKIGYVNFDEERLLHVRNFDEIIQAVRLIYENPGILLFDEIQNVHQWEIIVNRLHREGYKLVLTGSNSHLLAGDLATHLTGRHYATHIFPFSFREITGISKLEPTLAEKEQQCLDYIKRGGFPEIYIKNYDPAEYLSILFDSIILKDILKRYRLHFPNALVNLAKVMITNMTGEFTLNSISRLANISSIKTTMKYIGYLEEAFLLFSVPRFSYKALEQVKSGKKIYCYDNGFFQAKAFTFSSNMGKLLENAVAVRLRRKEMEGKLRLFYYKNRSNEEVDFVVQQEMKVSHLIQVCYSLSGEKVKNREVRSLIRAGNELGCSRLVVVTYDYEQTETHSWFGKIAEIEFIPLWKWLLADLQ
jgi:predicted AAA+ superfamily ATPase